MNLGETILKLRKQKNMTQSELAQKLNVTDKAVSKWERNVSCPDVYTITKIAEIFNVSVDELMSAQKSSQKKLESKQKVLGIFHLVLKAVALAMGIAVVVLSVLDDAVDIKTLIMFLGIGLFALALAGFDEKGNK